MNYISHYNVIIIMSSMLNSKYLTNKYSTKEHNTNLRMVGIKIIYFTHNLKKFRHPKKRSCVTTIIGL